MNWEDLNEEFIKNIENKNIKKILKKILYHKYKFFNQSRRSERTRLLKKILVDLGHDLEYKVYANGLKKDDVPGFVNREYLCDLIWYTEPSKTDYITESCELVMECEWDYNRKEDKNKINYSAMKYDFQKLVVINADLHLMIFKLKSNYNNDLNKLKEFFDKSLQSFNKLNKNFNLIVIGVISNKANKKFMVLNYYNYNA